MLRTINHSVCTRAQDHRPRPVRAMRANGAAFDGVGRWRCQREISPSAPHEGEPPSPDEGGSGGESLVRRQDLWCGHHGAAAREPAGDLRLMAVRTSGTDAQLAPPLGGREVPCRATPNPRAGFVMGHEEGRVVWTAGPSGRRKA